LRILRRLIGRLDGLVSGSYHPQGPVSAETKVVVFNAVPLFAVAVAYLAVAVAVAPRLLRERAGLTANDLAVGLIFPCIGISAAILGGVVLEDRNAIGGHLWLSFAATLIALLPALVFLARWGQRGDLLSGGARAREAEQLISARGRELEAVAAISDALARTTDPEAAGRPSSTRSDPSSESSSPRLR